MKRIAILGSTGSIGVNTLEVIADFADKFSVVALSANSNIELLYRQIKATKPKMVSVGCQEKAEELRKKIGNGVKIYFGDEGFKKIIQDKGLDLIVIAISASNALLPLLEAARHVKTVALANKEALVMAGEIIMKEAKKFACQIVPIDSEQSAIFQCLQGRSIKELKNVYLTASGGPLLDNNDDLSKIRPAEVLNHPKWKMGKKITVDSATLMNKGLEVIEAMHLFSIDVDKIKVVIHRQAIIHSMVEFIDGSIIAQLGITDMRLPIQYALSFPDRWPNERLSIDIHRLENLTFEPVDFQRFPCIDLAFSAARLRGVAPTVLNAANEEAVEAFLNNRLNFSNIPKVIEDALRTYKQKSNPKLDEILDSDQWARKEARKLIASFEPDFEFIN